MDKRKARPADASSGFLLSGRGERIRTSGLYVPKNDCGFQEPVVMRFSACFWGKYYTQYYIAKKWKSEENQASSVSLLPDCFFSINRKPTIF